MTQNSLSKDIELSEINLEAEIPTKPSPINRILMHDESRDKKDKDLVNSGNWAISEDGRKFSATLRNPKDNSYRTEVKHVRQEFSEASSDYSKVKGQYALSDDRLQSPDFKAAIKYMKHGQA
jgi:hypothetical protein